MFTKIKFVCLLVLFLVCSSIPFSQTSLTTFFGPVTFVRGEGEPLIEVLYISIAGFQGPYFLHLRNGNENGTQRVSSGWVYLNGNLLFGPRDFSQQAWGSDIPVELSEPSKLEVRLASEPGSKIKIWIEGTYIDPYQFQEMVIDPAGGTYQFWNGITLEVPEGAVDEPLTVSTRLIQTELVDTFLNNNGVSPMRCLVAFEALPHSYVFNLPIKVKLQCLPLYTEASMPLHFTIDVNREIFDYVHTDLSFSRETNIAELILNKFSDHAVFDIDLELQLKGGIINPWIDPDKIIWTLHSDCLTPETFCRCGTFHVLESSYDEIVDGECQVAIVIGEITYFDCLNAPIESWKLEYYKIGHIEIDPPEPIKIGETIELNAKVINSQGEEVPKPFLEYRCSSPEDEEIVRVINFPDHTATVQGLKCGEAHITVEAGCGNSREIIVDVWSSVASVTIIPGEETLGFYDDVILEAFLLDDDGNPVSGESVSWESTNPDVVSIYGTGNQVTAMSSDTAGLATIIARAGCDNVEPGYSYINVQGPVIPEVGSVEVSPNVECVTLNGFNFLNADIKDVDGNPIQGMTASWASSDPNIVSVDQIGGLTRVSGGWAWISATCQDKTGWALVGVPTYGANYVETWKISGLENNDYVIKGINNQGVFIIEIDDQNYVYDVNGMNPFPTIGLGSEPTDINELGQIVGAYYSSDVWQDDIGSFHNYCYSFIYQDGGYQTISVPQAVSTWATGINNLGHVVGYGQYYNLGYGYSDTFAFVYKNGEYQIFPYKQFEAINDSGNIAGIDINFNSFVFDGTIFYYELPEGWPEDINNMNQITGTTMFGEDVAYISVFQEGIVVSTYFVDGFDAEELCINDFGQIGGNNDNLEGGLGWGMILTPCPFPFPFGEDVYPPLLPPKPTIPSTTSIK